MKPHVIDMLSDKHFWLTLIGYYIGYFVGRLTALRKIKKFVKEEL